MNPKECARRRRGACAEDLVCAWLQWCGLAVLDRNRRAGAGEVDIVAREGDCLVFVEVRARRQGSWVTAASSVGPDKRRRLRDCARHLLREERFRWPHRRVRFDVVAIRSRREGLVLEHLRNVRLGVT
jgi:putative endonuclease